MMRAIILTLIRHRYVVFMFALLVLAGGYEALRLLPIDSFPDITPIRVEVDTEADGLASEEVEKLITYPIEQALQGIPKVKDVHSESKFSLSVVEVQFDSDTDLYWARSQVFQNLSNATLPAGVSPQMAPLDEGTGQVYIYALTSRTLNDMALRQLQDYYVKPLLRVVPGVADVPMFGGFTRQYQVNLNPDRLTALGLGVDDVVGAIQANNVSVGGSFIRRGSTQYIVRGLGLVRTVKDISDIVIKTNNGIPVTVGDVADVHIGPEDRQGAVSMNGQGEVVAGIVLKRLGENTAQVVSLVKQKLAEIEKGLRSQKRWNGLDTTDVKVLPIYDQSYLIDLSIHTVTSALIAGALLVIVILLLFVGNVSVALIPIFANFFCIAVAFILMHTYGITANLLSLGGIALSLGMMVDATVMLVENVYRHVMEVDHGNAASEDIVAAGLLEILKPTLIAIVVIIAVFLPVLALKGIEGQMFIPLALSVVFSMVGSLLMVLVVVPPAAHWLIRRRPNDRPHVPTRLMTSFLALYKRPLDLAIDHPWVVVVVCLVVMMGSIITFQFTGSEFLPSLEEGNFRLRITMPPSVSLPYAMGIGKRLQQTVLKTLPDEVVDVTSYVGRPELGGDPESVSNDELAIRLKPADQWPPGVTKASMEEKLRKAFSNIPGLTVQFSQELEMRTDEMISGFNTPIAVYVLGTDADGMLKTADMVKKVLEETPGAADVGVEHFTGIDNLDVSPNRDAMARYNVSTQNLMDVVKSLVGGTAAGQVYLDNQSYDITVRVQRPYRRDKAQIERLLVTNGSGLKLPLSSVATVKYASGFDHIDRWNGQRRLVVMADVKGRSVGSVVADAKARLEKAEFPPGISLHWGGQAEEAQHAFGTLVFAIPATLIVVFMLIYLCFDDVLDTIVVLTSVPLGIAGGTFLLMILDLHFNVPAYIGLIAKFGIAVQNGMIMVAYMNRLRETEGLDASGAARRAAMIRLRPELLSALIGSIGLVPFLMASGTGATVEAPLAAVVVGGVAVSRPLAWFLIPTLYAWFKGRPSES
ncbi:MAG: efflux RND transporter permease subunit [Candidatus Xenobia bacterium]